MVDDKQRLCELQRLKDQINHADRHNNQDLRDLAANNREISEIEQRINGTVVFERTFAPFVPAGCTLSPVELACKEIRDHMTKRNG